MRKQEILTGVLCIAEAVFCAAEFHLLIKFSAPDIATLNI